MAGKKHPDMSPVDLLYSKDLSTVLIQMLDHSDTNRLSAE
jgi:hypothetical protein